MKRFLEWIKFNLKIGWEFKEEIQLEAFGMEFKSIWINCDGVEQVVILRRCDDGYNKIFKMNPELYKQSR